MGNFFVKHDDFFRDSGGCELSFVKQLINEGKKYEAKSIALKRCL